MGKYTKDFGELVDTIVTECSLYPAVDYKAMSLPAPTVVHEALWDTGADICVMSTAVAESLGVKPYKQLAVHGLYGEETMDVYLLHIKLPTNDYVMNVDAVIGDKTNYDFVIGMNVMAYGDVAITTFEDKTIFSIRIPSEGHLKF